MSDLITCDCCNNTLKKWQTYTLSEALEDINICDSCKDKLLDSLLEYLRELDKGETHDETRSKSN